PSLHRNYPVSSVLRASPPPQTARPVSHEMPVSRSPLGLPVLHLIHFAYMPSPIPRQVRWNSFARTLPSSSAFPRFVGVSAPASPVSGPVQRSLLLRPTCSPSRQSDPLHQRLQQLHCFHCCFDCYRAERTSSRSGTFTHWWTSAFSRRTTNLG